jgi:hypothetical protein
MHLAHESPEMKFENYSALSGAVSGQSVLAGGGSLASALATVVTLESYLSQPESLTRLMQGQTTVCGCQVVTLPR